MYDQDVETGLTFVNAETVRGSWKTPVWCCRCLARGRATTGAHSPQQKEQVKPDTKSVPLIFVYLGMMAQVGSLRSAARVMGNLGAILV